MRIIRIWPRSIYVFFGRSLIYKCRLLFFVFLVRMEQKYKHGTAGFVCTIRYGWDAFE